MRIEAWACFRHELSVSVYGSEWKALVQILQELHNGFSLRFSSCIFRGFAILCKSPDIADTDTVSVLSDAVCTRLGDWSPCVYAAIAIYDVVIANVLEPSCKVPFAYLFYSVVAPLWGCATMDNEFINCSHRSMDLSDVVARRGISLCDFRIHLFLF